MQIAHQAGFRDINADILLAVPNQYMVDIRFTIYKLSELPVTHISAYGLILEPGTPMTQSIESGELVPVSEKLAVKMYDYAYQLLDKLGFKCYEISNFAKPGYESRHNLNYWNRGQYLGLGLNSHSFVNGYHWQNTCSLDEYLVNPTDNIIDVELQTQHSARLETIMLALRLERGLNIADFDSKFNANFIQEYQHVLQPLIEQGLVIIQDNHLRVLDHNLSNSIISMFA